MVNFICDACGQTIKKQKVEKHYQNECRNCSVLSCIDCGKDFPGDSYVSHTSCISEAEKYQGKLYKAKDKGNKGERKQQEWLEQVRNATGGNGSQDPRVRKLMAKITSYDNVPRKEAKFKKFCENSINIRDQSLLEKLWLTFSAARNGTSNNNQTTTSAVPVESTETMSCENGKSEDSESKIVENIDQEDKPNELSQKPQKESKSGKKKKRKMETDEAVNGNEKDDETLKRTNKRKRKTEKDEPVNIEDDKNLKRKNKKKRKMEKDELVDENENMKESMKNRKRELDDEEGMNDENKKMEYEDNGIKEKENEMEQDVEMGKKMNLKDMENIEKFNWEAVIKKVLKSAPDNEMAVKKLRKKVINEFLAQGGDLRTRTEQELRTLFEKKLHKNPKVKVHKEKARYCK